VLCCLSFRVEWMEYSFLFPKKNVEGVWFMHCHLEVHKSWGLKMAWVVNYGPFSLTRS
jgi:hypothetical protein